MNKGNVRLDQTHQDWKTRAASLDFRHQAFIDGKFVDAASGKTFDSINPATGAVLASVAEGDAEDVNRAVTAARRAFEAMMPMKKIDIAALEAAVAAD